MELKDTLSCIRKPVDFIYFHEFHLLFQKDNITLKPPNRLSSIVLLEYVFGFFCSLWQSEAVSIQTRIEINFNHQQLGQENLTALCH